jgi:hypothetical protein
VREQRFLPCIYIHKFVTVKGMLKCLASLLKGRAGSILNLARKGWGRENPECTLVLHVLGMFVPVLPSIIFLYTA